MQYADPGLHPQIRNAVNAALDQWLSEGRSAMHDMLVKLYDLPDHWALPEKLVQQNITIRKPIGPEKQLVVDWVRGKFFKVWASETDVALSNRPITCFVAIKNKKLLGFACYDATALGYFGPTGVAPMSRGKGIGQALLMATLIDMKHKGYGYAIIGGVGPAEYYRKMVGATDIVDSSPGIWKTWVR